MDELIIAQFSQKTPTGQSYAKGCLLDPRRRSKIVFTEKRSELASLLGSSVWRCAVVRDTEPDNGRKGAVIVEPLHRLAGELGKTLGRLDQFRYTLLDKRQRKIQITGAGIRKLVIRPWLAEHIEEAVSRLDLKVKTGRRRKFHVELDEAIGSVYWIQAPEIGMHDSTAFAFSLGLQEPHRVLIPEYPLIQTDILRLHIRRYSESSNRSRATLCLYGVGHDSTPQYPHPAVATSDKGLESSLKFWREHALVYDPATMGDPFICTWQQVLDKEYDTDFRPEYQIRMDPQATPRSNPLLQ